MQASQQGLSLVELLVGMAVGLIVTSVALAAAAAHLRENQRILVDARLMQDLRTVTDLLSRDLRRAASLTATSEGVRFSRADDADERAYRLRDGVIDMKIGSGHWQAMTDATTLRVSALQITPHTHETVLDGFCSRACLEGSADRCPPRQLRRTVDVSVTAQPARDIGAPRGATSTVQLRHDALVGGCPA